jgi:uncharacterized protein
LLAVHVIAVVIKRKKIAVACAKKAATRPRMEETPSPCTGICRIESRTQLCVGCKRSLNEIAGWSAMSHSEKREILARLPARRAT